MIKNGPSSLRQAPFRVQRAVGTGAILIGWRFVAVSAFALLTSITLGYFDSAPPTPMQLAETRPPRSTPADPFTSVGLKRTTVEEPHSATLLPETGQLETRPEPADIIVPVEVETGVQPVATVQMSAVEEPATSAAPNVTKVSRASSTPPLRSVRQRATVAAAQPPVRSAETFRAIEAPGPERGGS